ASVYIGERSYAACKSVSIGVAAVADGVDHLRRFRTGDSVVRAESAIFVAVDDAQGGEHVYGFGGFDVRLIRKRRTGTHGERAGERQHQSENFVLMAGE